VTDSPVSPDIDKPLACPSGLTFIPGLISTHTRRLAGLPCSDAFEMPEHLNRMKILKKTFAIGKPFDYISAPRQTEQFAETR